MENSWDTIRPTIEEKIKELRSADTLDPQTLANKMIELSSWWASVNKEMIERLYWYNTLLRERLVEHGTATKAVIYAQATKEYKDYKEAEAYSKSILEIIRGGRRSARLSEEEKRNAQY